MTHTADNTDRQENAMPHDRRGQVMAAGATPLPPRPLIASPTPPQASGARLTEHPVRCPARLSVFAFVLDPASNAHTHECIHPAKVPDGVVGVLEHACHCGATWSERSSVGGTTTSSEEQAT